MNTTNPDPFHPSDLLGLSDLQRRIITHIMREGPAYAGVLARALGLDLPDVQDTLDELVRQRSLALSEGGEYRVALGHSHRRTLPAKLWRPLLTSDRLYSEQEIATLNTCIPFLQFARARLGNFADHGYGHALRVKSFATQLSYLLGLTQTERHLLRSAALLHDVGNAVDRSRHNSISQQAVLDLTASGELPFSQVEAELVGLLCRWHRREYEPDRQDHLGDELVRTGFLASILRVSDALDIDQRRFDYTRRLMRVIEYFYRDDLPFWTSHTEIPGIRIHFDSKLALQVFYNEPAQIEKNLQFMMLRGDLASTPLNWRIEQIPVSREPSALSSAAWSKPALLVFPFEPHSLIMAALTRRQLRAVGAGVELYCYPDTAGSSAWLWTQALPELSPKSYGQLVVIGDRPDSSVLHTRQSVLEQWHFGGARVCLLNRHEGNWSALPALCHAGAEVLLGGDWAYFYGQNVGARDLAWGRVAALVTRDPTLAIVGLDPEEMAVARGLLKTVYDAASHPAEDIAGWSALAEPLLERIAGNDRNAGWAFFLSQSADFSSTWGRAAVPSRVLGRTLLFEDSAGVPLESNYWAMEATIEAQGRTLERGISFNAPYAIAVRQIENDTVELLAINHWREEKAIPIRLLCPPDLDPPPAGHEGCVFLSLPARRARVVVQSLVAACNQSLEQA